MRASRAPSVKPGESTIHVAVLEAIIREEGTQQIFQPPVVRQSRYSYPETISRLTTAIAQAGSTVFAAIDQSAAAEAAGLSLRPTTLLIFGNPKAGTPLMDAQPLAGLDLPLKLLIWEKSGVVEVAYVTATVVGQRYAVSGMDPLIAALDRTLQSLVAAVA